MHIVIADDDPIARTLADHALTPCGVTISQVENGDAVWRIVKERTVPTVLILDRMMPGFDGVSEKRHGEPWTFSLRPYFG